MEEVGHTQSGLHWVEVKPESFRLFVDTRLYPEEVVFRTCYLFTDRCYLFLTTRQPDEVIVEFRQRKRGTVADEIIGDFCNELVNQRVRYDLSRETRAIRELIVAQAFSEADFHA